jgi:hypothetical protein
LHDIQGYTKIPITLEPCKEGSALMKTMEKIFQDISMQMLKTKYILDLGHLIKIPLDLKWYLWQKMKLFKNKKVSKPILNNTSTRANGTPLEGDIL